MPWCLSPEQESELERSLGKCLVWGCQVYTQVEFFQEQELGSQVWGCSLEFPPE